MAAERTLAIIKPDAIEKGIIGEIMKRIDDASLKVIGMKMQWLDKPRTEGFYEVHKDKPFFGTLCEFMASGPSIVMALEGENAINNWRNVMGVTDPEKADEGSIRCDFGTNIERNAVHGSDATETAKFEIAYFFEGNDLFQYEWV